MKKVFIILFALTLTLSLCTRSEAATVSKATLTGKAVLYAPADKVTISYVIEDHGKGEKNLNEKAQEIQKSISEYGIPALDGYFSYTDQSGKEIKARTYVISSPRTKDASAIMNKLINGGASSVSSPVYSLENRTELEKNALKEAVENAKARASACGIKGDPTALHDFGSDPDCCHFSFSACPDGRVQIECRVVLSYRG